MEQELCVNCRTGSGDHCYCDKIGKDLTRKELEVMKYVASGYTNDQICELVGISTGTLNVHTQNVYRKLGVNTRAGAIAKLFAQGILKCSDLMHPALSPREMDIIYCVLQGMDGPEIGENLFISASTVNSHMRSIYSKLKVNNRASLVVSVVSLGIVNREKIEELALSSA